MLRRILGLGILLASTSVGAQVVETPVPFDSTGRVQSITPPLAARLGLTAPLWPVEGDYTEVRLYELSTGGFVLAVSRPTGAISRYSLTVEQRAALQARISEAMARVGRPATEENPEIISERAGGAFMMSQMILAFSLYGGSLATLVAEPTGSTAVYLMAPAATFFIAGNYVRRHPISRAQNHLATDGAPRVALMGNGLLYVLGVEGGKSYAAATFAGGLAGTIAGVRAGRGMTDGEAHGATWGSTSTALTSLGLLGASGAFNDSPTSGRVIVAVILGAATGGYPLGLRYVRRARYVVTAGDVSTLAVASVIGTLAAVAPIADAGNISGELAAGIVTAGFVGGQIVGDRVLVRPYDHTGGEGFLVGLGAAAGMLMGGGIAVLADPSSAFPVLALITGGAIAGVALTENMIEPRRAGTSTPRRAAVPHTRRPHLALSPAGVVQTMARVPGRASLLTITF